ncbi:DNA polymerase/3'-5' exonuclease PolX [Mariniradius sediminis]|uniref:Helix-hairpin-helix domain-containing protein n=1 Tax=Mariniradius sediminis TaxID=2909237 RepID=A0ABS9BSN4_9BACT|nr:DNA polymerase/3'-5' exonuclease PolX [Mariniradius sediminis]MCF1750586.1 helix-hairpin-helix domain-containing protein [Mariniradius sediminis]
MDANHILRQLKLTIKLMELHDENPFKIRSLQSAVNNIDRGEIEIEGKSPQELQNLPGIGKSIADSIVSLQATGSFPGLDELLAKTPSGILEVLEIKGLGPKKVKALWEELNITSTHELMEACQSGQVAKIKGFGEKTQESIIQSLQFKEANQGKWLYADLEAYMDELVNEIKKNTLVADMVPVGEYGRKLEIIDQVEWLIATDDRKQVLHALGKISSLERDRKISSPFTWRGKLTSPEVRMVFHFSDPADLILQKIVRTSAKAHMLHHVQGEKSLVEIIREEPHYYSEAEAYEKAGLPLIPAELREGLVEFDLAKSGKIDLLVTDQDLKGILHNHSTYSDGKHTLRQMAEHCRDLGYEYLGISDHSRTAFYAGGLEIERVQQQHREIDLLNQELAPFRIFKGIESDILIDGSLDYPEDVLSTFDFVVASVHSSLNMDVKKATQRLLKAIESQYTTILGHPTGRLLLRRGGYPIDHKAIIQACAGHGVVIEINANPWRLDLDWRWVQEAMDKGVKLSINPDAHEMEGYADMRYGVIAGRKGGLTRDMTFNALSLKEMEAYLQQRKNSIKKS